MCQLQSYITHVTHLNGPVVCKALYIHITMSNTRKDMPCLSVVQKVSVYFDI